MTEQAESALAAIAARRSIRRFQDRPVEPEKLRAVLDAAILAPSAANAQPWAFVVVQEAETRERLADLILEAHDRYYADVRVTAPGESMAELRGRAAGLGGAPTYVVVCVHRRRRYVRPGHEARTRPWDLVSAAAAMENLLLAASALGLGACWLGVPTLRAEALKALLGIPDDAEVIGVTPLGYPDEAPGPRPRLPLEEVLHFDRW
jgi:F420 biosynthesis protein FbiB-like protein